MFASVVVCLNLMLSTAVGADLPESQLVEPVAALAAGPKMPKNVVDAAKDEVDKKKSEAEERADARLAAIEEMQSGKAARVVILQWPGTDVNFESETLQRNVRTRIARPDAKFYPEIDLYQAGRKEPDKTVRPEDQRSTVPDDSIGLVENAVAMVETIPWNGLSTQDWGLKADELRRVADEIWFMDRPELREPLFKLFVQIGRAADNASLQVPPYYSYVGGMTVPYYWYLAGAMAYEDPQLMSLITDQDLHASVGYYKDSLEDGGVQMMTLSFEEFGIFDPGEFTKQYEVFINGRDVYIDHPKGLKQVPPGRVDVYLKRTDGHSISDRIELDKLGEKIYGVRATARLRMGNEFIDQLMEHPNECTPQVDGDILTYLAIYAKLHPEAEVYVAIPEGGSPNKVRLWRWKRYNGTLELVLDDTGGFPVRFAGLVGAGFVFSGVTATEPGLDAEGNIEEPKAKPVPAGVPILYHLRGHYGRLMFAFGVEYSVNVKAGDNNFWSGAWQTGGQDSPDDWLLPEKKLALQRLGFLQLGGVLMKDAAIGFGPRGAVRVGWYNVPHAYDLTFHVGLSEEAPIGASTGRVRPVVDVDFFAGMMFPFETTLQTIKVLPTFGTTVSAGITF